ncbi:MAG: hypothetical protein P1Q69_16625 [Candidatus Thorarchaeota archaeon]|nr:hypothetical protein [Candidatus Thorarchaeota archaeon]
MPPLAYNEYSVKTGIKNGVFASILIALPLQLMGLWYLMPLSGAIGGMVTKKAGYAFVAGFMGVGIAWSMLHMVLNTWFLLYQIAGFIAPYIGFPWDGRWLVSLGVLLGGLLGGTGGISGRLFVEVIRPEEERNEETNEIDGPLFEQPLW